MDVQNIRKNIYAAIGNSGNVIYINPEKNITERNVNAKWTYMKK